jgi:hypothetical protein
MFFKVRIPGGGSEALMPMLSWNKSSFALPRPVGVLLHDELVEVGFHL